MPNEVLILLYLPLKKEPKGTDTVLVATSDGAIYCVSLDSVERSVSSFFHKKALEKKAISICWFPELHQKYPITLEDKVLYHFNLLEMSIDAQHRRMQIFADIRQELRGSAFSRGSRALILDEVEAA